MINNAFIVWSKRKTGKITTERRDFADERAITNFMHNNPLCASVRWNQNPKDISEDSPELRRDEKLGTISRINWSNCE
jgi:hypothetical protein